MVRFDFASPPAAGGRRAVVVRDRFLITENGFEVGDLSQTSVDHALSLDLGGVEEIEIITKDDVLSEAGSEKPVINREGGF